MIFIFHRKIKAENRDLIQRIIDVIQPKLNENNYESVKSLPERRQIDYDRTPINIGKIFFVKNDAKFAISVEIYD